MMNLLFHVNISSFKNVVLIVDWIKQEFNSCERKCFYRNYYRLVTFSNFSKILTGYKNQ